MRHQGALLGAYSWGDQGSDEGHRPLWLIDHLEGPLFVGFLGSAACGDVTETVLVDFGSGNVHPVPGLDPEADLRRSPILFAARLAEPPAPPTVTPTPTPSDPDATTFRYDTYDTTGAVSTPGSYAFLTDADGASWAVTTYQGLRDGTATALLIHTSDADGVSRAGVYDAVEVGDQFEWHQADDCFVRYLVSEVKPDPAGTMQRKLLAVAWMTYAFTGCSGVIPASTVATVDWGELPDLGGTSLTAPVIHGVYQITPAGWRGTTKTYYEEDMDDIPSYKNPVFTRSLADAQKLPFWRDPDLPQGVLLDRAVSGGLANPGYRYSAYYQRANGQPALTIEGYRSTTRYYEREASWDVTGLVDQIGAVMETRVIAGRPAYVIYNPNGLLNCIVLIYDEETNSEYHIQSSNRSVTDPEVATAIARSLFAEPPTSDATTLRYDTYDTTGAVDTAGSYAFLADPDDPSTVVTTYEGLRDGTTTALLIHTSDADGVSRADVYDAVASQRTS